MEVELPGGPPPALWVIDGVGTGGAETGDLKDHALGAVGNDRQLAVASEPGGVIDGE